MKYLYNKLLSYINSLNFQEKVRLTFLFISLIPLCILGTYSFTATSALLSRQQTANLRTTLIQTEQMLDKQFNLYDKIIRSLCFNQQLIATSHIEFSSAYDKYEQLRFIDDLFVMTQNLTSGIEGITFYTDSSIGKHGNTLLPLADAMQQDWYASASSYETTWYSTKDSLLCIRPVLSPRFSNDKSSYIVMKISPTIITETLNAIDETKISAVIATPEHKIILSNSLPLVTEDMLSTIMSSDSDCLKTRQYTALMKEISNTSWRVIICSSTQNIFFTTILFSMVVLLIIIFCFVIVLIASRIFSGKIVYRIQLLRENMQQVENGVLEVNVESTSNDEIGDLIDSFSKMVTKIKQLIEENYLATIAKKDYELKALQSQINPHFLYNSLSLINWRALRLHATEISEMAQLLSSFYRTTLNKGSSITTVAEEFVNVKSYLQIQLIMHSHEFDVEYQIEDSTSNYSMPNLMLQPLVENAIIHGLENKKGAGKITVSCLKKEDYLLFIVRDNGIGIPKELLPNILESNSSGYGLKNVNQRAKLLYGDAYGLSIESTENVGTAVMLTIPLCLQ